jgi:hypothetical protein
VSDSEAAEARPRWYRTPAVRLGGYTLGWFLIALGIALLAQMAIALSDLGGFCARGGPFEIETECTDRIALWGTTSPWIGLAGVAIVALAAGGFGVRLLALAWPMLFVSLGAVFLRTFVISADGTGLGLGIMFIVMGLAPLALELYSSPQRVLLGVVDARGRRLAESRPARPILTPAAPAPGPDAVPPTVLHGILSLGLVALAVSAGVSLAIALFAAT